MELLAPAGSPESLTAAVQSGADAVYLGYGPLNARRNAKNFSQEELRQAVSSGEYQPDPVEIAKRLLFHLEG